MRQIILDTETTGLFPQQGHRIVQIGCIEICNSQCINSFKSYLNPERGSDTEALKMHGLTSAFLKDKPKFSDIVDNFLTFIKDAELIIHNAPFDLCFLNHELSLMGKPAIENYCRKITDTKVMSTTLFPDEFFTRELVTRKLAEDETLVQKYREELGDNDEALILALSKNKNFKIHSLDHLCKYYRVSLSLREKHHDAMIACELLAQVYTHLERAERTLKMFPSSPVKAGMFSPQQPEKAGTAPTTMITP